MLYVLLRYKFSVRSFAHKSLYVGVLISHLTGMSLPSMIMSAPRPGSLPAAHLSLLRVDAGAMVVEGTVEVTDDCVEGAEVGIGEAPCNSSCTCTQRLARHGEWLVSIGVGGKPKHY